MTKRLNGEGHIRQRSDGRWETQLTVDGKRVSIYGKTAEDVAAIVAFLASDAAANLTGQVIGVDGGVTI